MKGFKKVFALLIVLVTAFVLISCDKDKAEKKLVIRAWNDEFQGLFRKYYPDFKETKADGTDVLKDGTIVKWVIVANENNAYQIALDEALKNQESVYEEERIDMFLVEADYALKYVDSDYSLPVADLGITTDDLKNQYAYTQKVMTSSDGKLKGLSWQATPGLYAYRQDIAEEVFGKVGITPEEVQAKISDWTKFEAVAAQMKAKGYTMLAGNDDAYRTFSNNVSAPWVNANKEIVVDQNILNWIEQTKRFADAGYNNQGADYALWGPGWQKEQGPTGKTFGFFYSTWGINFTLMGNSLGDSKAEKKVGNGLFGKYRVVTGPQSYYWGGSWLVSTKFTDQKDLVKDIMMKFTFDKDIMKSITLDTLDYTNNKVAMGEIANDPTYGSAFLGGQNHIKLFAEAAEKIDLKTLSIYDQGLNEGIQTAMKGYFAGDITLEKAWENFYDGIKALYPSLKKKS
ncbi:MAG: ABC transporter substrate-binding protein [Acholeplasma sp.]|nr:ABC transporter substrate-binding protein [Acholeplasma sp.]